MGTRRFPLPQIGSFTPPELHRIVPKKRRNVNCFTQYSPTSSWDRRATPPTAPAGLARNREPLLNLVGRSGSRAPFATPFEPKPGRKILSSSAEFASTQWRTFGTIYPGHSDHTKSNIVLRIEPRRPLCRQSALVTSRGSRPATILHPTSLNCYLGIDNLTPKILLESVLRSSVQSLIRRPEIAGRKNKIDSHSQIWTILRFIRNSTNYIDNWLGISLCYREFVAAFFSVRPFD